MEKKGPVSVHIWVKFSFKIQFQEYLEEKTAIFFPCGAFLLYVVNETEPTLPQKNPDCAPAFSISFYLTYEKQHYDGNFVSDPKDMLKNND